MGTVRNSRVNADGPKVAGIVGSFARGYARAGVKVLAWDPDGDVMGAAEMGTIEGVLTGENLGTCDIIVLACYPEACIEWLEKHADALADATDIERLKDDVERIEGEKAANDKRMRMLMTQIDSLDPADRSYERKFNDLQRRLDALYDRDAGSAWTESAGFWKSLTASPSCWKERTSRRASTSFMRP